MTFGFPIATSTVALAAAVLGGLTVVFYILKMRRRRFEVPFSTLWQRVLREKEASSLWKHLKRILSLLLMLSILGTLLFAVLDPQLGAADDDAKNVVIIVDASASMATADQSDDQTRLEVAKKKATGLLDAMGGGDTAMIMKMDGRTTPLSRFVGDKARLRKVVNGIEISHTPAELRRALMAASDALRDRKNPMVVVIGDGAYPEQVLRDVVWTPADSEGGPESESAGESGVASTGEAGALSKIDLTGIDVRYIAVGEKDQNVGIVAFNVRRYITNKLSYEAFVEVQNFAPAPEHEALVERVAAQFGVAPEAVTEPPADEGSIPAARGVAMYLSWKLHGKSEKDLGEPFGVSDEVLLEIAREIDTRVIGDAELNEAVTALEDTWSAPRKLTLYNGDTPIKIEELTLVPSEKRRYIFPDQGGGDDHRLRAVLAAVEGHPRGSDAFDLDDEAYALVPKRTRQHVLLVTEDNLYLEAAMLVYENIVVDKLLAAEYEAMVVRGELDDYDAVVFDDYTPENLPATNVNLLYFNPSGDNAPFDTRRTLSAPLVTEINDSHPVMRWLKLSNVNFDEVTVFDVDRAVGEIWLARSVRDPIIAAKKDGRRKIIACGFSLAGTDLMLRVAFPMFLVNTLEWFSGDDSDLITTYGTGQRIRVPMDGTYQAREVEVKSPGGAKTRAPLVEGAATFYSSWVGIHRLQVRQNGEVVASIELAANLANPTESDIAPSTELYFGGQKLKEPEGFEITHRSSLWLYLVAGAMLLIFIEWVTYNRRITV